MSKNVLILGGTTEARHLAEMLVKDGIDVTTSLAGRTEKPIPLPGHIRIGGFGGVDGFTKYLRETKPDLIIDATHPYAAQMGSNALSAAQICAIPLLRLEREPWRPEKNDHWVQFESAEVLASEISTLNVSRVFLTLGGANLSAFRPISSVTYIIRAIDPPEGFDERPDTEIVLASGPFDLDAEISYLSRQRIDLVVSRNSGGTATRPKMDAARVLSIPVAMIVRPARANTEVVFSVPDAMDWVKSRIRLQ